LQQLLRPAGAIVCSCQPLGEAVETFVRREERELEAGGRT